MKILGDWRVLCAIALSAGFTACTQDARVSAAATMDVVMSAHPAPENPPEYVQLSWSATNATRCSAQDAWSGHQPSSGTVAVRRSARAAIYGMRCWSVNGEGYARAIVPPVDHPAYFPVRPSRTRRYLEDAHGQPFFLHGEAAWSLIAELTREETLRYLDDRRTRGFNTLLVNLLEHKFARRAPANAYGDRPFLDKPFHTPNAAYFDHAEWVVRAALDRGFLLLIVPAYLGYGGGEQGWYETLRGTDPLVLREYGRYIGERFAPYSNVIWTYGGDYDPPDKNTVLPIIEGTQLGRATLSTAHAAPETVVRDFWRDAPWLQLNNVYSYTAVTAKARAEYVRQPSMPFFLLESTYENEQSNDVALVRGQSYRALLSGASGHVFGNNPIWHFSGPGLSASPHDWVNALDSAGTRSMTHLLHLFTSLRWWTLEPDLKQRLLKSGVELDDPVAAISTDQQVAIVYLPRSRSVELDLRELECRDTCFATWFDPASGRFGPTLTLDSDATVQLEPPRGSSLSSDRVLIVESGSARHE